MKPDATTRRTLKLLIAWLPLIVLPAGAYLVAIETWPRWGVMWLLAMAIYAGCKWLTWSTTAGHSLRRGRDWGYLLTWPGLDARAFLAQRPIASQDRPTRHEWAGAIGKMFAGAGLWVLATYLVPLVSQSANASTELAVGWLAMIAFVLGLHCGLFHLLSCAWRAGGVNARRVMDRPLQASSLSDFWGRRWNTAFRDLAHRYVFAPLGKRWGPHCAILFGFLFSGVIHDAVISVPAGGGYGGPTFFFALQGAGMLAQRVRGGQRQQTCEASRNWGQIRQRGLTLLVLVVPAGCLFQPVFVQAIVLPMLRDLAAAVGT